MSQVFCSLRVHLVACCNKESKVFPLTKSHIVDSAATGAFDTSVHLPNCVSKKTHAFIFYQPVISDISLCQRNLHLL